MDPGYVHPDKVPLAFGIEIAPQHHIPFTIPRDWHEVLFHKINSQCMFKGTICFFSPQEGAVSNNNKGVGL